MNFLNFIDPHILIGLGLAMHIEAAVEYLKAHWKLNGQLAPYVASILAFLVQLVIVYAFHLPLTDTLVGTIFTTAGACFWHELSTPTE